MMYLAAIMFFGGIVIGEFWILAALVNRLDEERQRASNRDTEILKLKNEISRLSIRIGKLEGKENK